MYLPKTKYSVSVAGPGDYSLDGRPYVGPVLTDYRGNTYAGSDPDHLLGRVELQTVDTEPAGEVAARRVPTGAEYKQGSMIRYFRQHNRSRKVEELAGRSETEDLRYTYASASWILTGSLEDKDYHINGRSKPLVIRGVRYKNNLAMQSLEKVLPGISGSVVLDDPAEFVVESKKSC